MHQRITRIARPNRLRRKACRPEAQKIGERKNRVEHQRAQDQSAEQGGIAEPANDGDIDQSHQRLGDERHRSG